MEDRNLQNSFILIFQIHISHLLIAEGKKKPRKIRLLLRVREI